MKESIAHQSLRFTYFIIGTIAFSQGIMGLSDLAISYMQKDDYKYDPAETQFISTLVSLPWIVKPFWGILTDTVPLFGYRRKSYLMLFGLLGFMMWNTLADYGVENPTIGIALMIGINISIAFCNVIGEALLVELSGQATDDETGSHHDSASSNVTFFFGMRSVGTFATAYLSGELLDYLDKRTIYRITSFFPLTLAIIAIFIKEKKHTKSDSKDEQIKTGESLATFYRFVQEPAIYKPIILIMAFMSCPSVSTAMFYFYSNVLSFGPEFIGQLRLVYSLCSILAAFLFNKFLKNVKFTKVFGYSTFIYFFVSCQTTLLVTRTNLRFGIPDKLYCFGDGVLNQVVGELNTMPVLVLACKMCPKNIEGTMYALLMSAINCGGMISGQLGAIITYYFGVTENDFHNLGWLIVITSASTLLPLPFLGIIKEDELEKVKQKYQRQDVPYLEVPYEDEVNEQIEVNPIQEQEVEEIMPPENKVNDSI